MRCCYAQTYLSGGGGGKLPRRNRESHTQARIFHSLPGVSELVHALVELGRSDVFRLEHVLKEVHLRGFSQNEKTVPIIIFLKQQQYDGEMNLRHSYELISYCDHIESRLSYGFGDQSVGSCLCLNLKSTDSRLTIATKHYESFISTLPRQHFHRHWEYMKVHEQKQVINDLKCVMQPTLRLSTLSPNNTDSGRRK